MARLTSVEHDEKWFEKVRVLITQSNIDGIVDYRRAESDEIYVDQIDTFEDNSIDFCLVDGVNRDKCALRMIPKLKPGALLVIDNVNWFLPNDWSRSPNTRRSVEGCASQEWQQFQNEVASWRSLWTTNGVWDTCILFKI